MARRLLCDAYMCFYQSTLLQLERHQHRITFHHLPTFHDERDDRDDENKKEKVLTTLHAKDWKVQRMTTSIIIVLSPLEKEEMDGRNRKWKGEQKMEVEREQKIEVERGRWKGREEDGSEERKMSKATLHPFFIHQVIYFPFFSFKSYVFWLIVSHWLMMMMLSWLLARLKRDFTFFFYFLCFNCYFRLPACSTPSISLSDSFPPRWVPLWEIWIRKRGERYDE